MNSEEIKELIDEVKTSQEPPLERAKLLASMLQAYHLAKIGETLTNIEIHLCNSSGDLSNIEQHLNTKGNTPSWQYLIPSR